ncbi:hypothetical protein ACFPYM_12390 [Methylobacterium hispanicum]|uniref:hypothetical protein n=1 Tax=Methylobacterium TaxID=407 RepID=UPI0012E3BC60|nr:MULTISPECIES: hypothetical protein [Methylobacterium]
MARSFTPQQLNDLTADESFIVTYLTTKNDINITEAALAMNKSWPTVSKAMLSLLERGIIEFTDNKGRKHDSKKYTN